MNRFNFSENKFGTLKTISLSDDTNGNAFEILMKGATPLRFLTQINGKQFNILDGFANEKEALNGSGARCWIMTPFANRIPNGKYSFNGKDLQLNPVPPRTQVIHGFTSFENFELSDVNSNGNYIELTLAFKKIRPGVFTGYPFAINVYVKYKFEDNKITITVTGENVGDEPAPFHTGWHPYFKASDKGIENLILAVDADQTILIDKSLIPLPGVKAYANVDDNPQLDFRNTLPEEKRRIGKRILDNCYASLKSGSNGLSASSIFDPDNGLKISMFQKGGVTLLFSGDTLSDRVRQSVAVEPMQYPTNAFNRDEFKNQITILPGQKSIFEFGVEISRQ